MNGKIIDTGNIEHITQNEEKQNKNATRLATNGSTLNTPTIHVHWQDWVITQIGSAYAGLTTHSKNRVT